VSLKLIGVLSIPLVIGLFAAAFRLVWLDPFGDELHFVPAVLRYVGLTYALSTALGVPAYLLVRFTRLRSAWAIVLLGAVLGAISGVLIPALVGVTEAKKLFSGVYPYPLEYAMFGAITAGVCWWLVIYRRPAQPADERSRLPD
jgi:hypothetical protein